MKQIPIVRGKHDSGAIDQAVAALRAGEMICVFPEGKLSLGRDLPARGGVTRLVRSVPEAKIVLCAVSGATGYVRLPRRPRVRVQFFEPEQAALADSEPDREFSARLLEAVRRVTPPDGAGRKPEKTRARLEAKGH